ncbi:hypothetical protein Q0F98_11640 [Paenibacillus amylolyticus]|nr:hypothetical protein Q0F98_11640 [Paenibacillus amylolyticus]
MDNESQHWVQQALNVLMKGRTTILIAHRLSTVEHADLITVMNQGTVVRTGPPSGPAGARRLLRGCTARPALRRAASCCYLYKLNYSFT